MQTPKPRCGAPLAPSTDKRRRYETCRHIVKPGGHCHRHRTEAEEQEAFERALRPPREEWER